MYRIDEDLKDDYAGCDYYSTFIKKSIRDLKIDGICYVFYQDQVDEILKYMKVPVDVTTNECGYTLNIPRNKRNYKKEI